MTRDQFIALLDRLDSGPPLEIRDALRFIHAVLADPDSPRPVLPAAAAVLRDVGIDRSVRAVVRRSASAPGLGWMPSSHASDR